MDPSKSPSLLTLRPCLLTLTHPPHMTSTSANRKPVQLGALAGAPDLRIVSLIKAASLGAIYSGVYISTFSFLCFHFMFVYPKATYFSTHWHCTPATRGWSYFFSLFFFLFVAVFTAKRHHA
ncbi:hypothetical protein B0H63DRAFT_58848 [Podospora didyma]|uniref:Uncharacterized protein n=1 Tax=Podospora didyma TaxID=330526 RepID=A0AAE0P7Q5_9PEZI|nr:hypothetical protein B0H63DRAFT_58848 [Podospora didyma]